MHEANYIKKYFTQLSKGREVAMVLDLHGHSRKLFSFFYGNPSSSNPIEPRVYPYLCSKLGPNLIRF
jgi:cytosolic carboxypeptidase protein 2/3